MDEKLSKEVLLNLGFEENFVSKEESGDFAYAYYTLNLEDNSRGECLISDSDDKAVDGFFQVSLFSHETLGICYTKQEVKDLYKTLKRKELKEK